MRAGIADTRLRSEISALSAQILLTIALISAVGVLGITFLTFVLTRLLWRKSTKFPLVCARAFWMTSGWQTRSNG